MTGQITLKEYLQSRNGPSMHCGDGTREEISEEEAEELEEVRG